MKRKIPLLISALCVLCACASFTACMTESQNGNDENTEKARAKTNIVEQQNPDDSDCPDDKCPSGKNELPDAEDMPPMPEFRFIPHPEHMPNATNIDKNTDSKNDNNANSKDSDNEDEEIPEDENSNKDDKKPPMPAPHKGGKIKPKMPKKGK